MSSNPTSPERQQASEWLRRGQMLEAKGTAESVASALTCYEQAAGLLQALSSVPEVARQLSIALMNRGNALHKLGRLDESVAAYDAAISHLKALLPADNAARNSLGAAWMNRGYVLLRQGTPETRTESIRAQDEAISILQGLPCGEVPAYRFNLAGAWLNRAQALLGSGPAAADDAHTDASTALGLVAPLEREEPLAASIGLMARHALCTAAAIRLESGRNPEWLTTASDGVDDAMALVRHWQQRQIGAFRPHAIALYRF